MKTTLDIEPEFYRAAEQLARSQHKSVGQMISELLRQALGLIAGAEGSGEGDFAITELERRNGIATVSFL